MLPVIQFDKEERLPGQLALFDLNKSGNALFKLPIRRYKVDLRVYSLSVVVDNRELEVPFGFEVQAVLIPVVLHYIL